MHMPTLLVAVHLHIAAGGRRRAWTRAELTAVVVVVVTGRRGVAAGGVIAPSTPPRAGTRSAGRIIAFTLAITLSLTIVGVRPPANPAPQASALPRGTRLALPAPIPSVHVGATRALELRPGVRAALPPVPAEPAAAGRSSAVNGTPGVVRPAASLGVTVSHCAAAWACQLTATVWTQKEATHPCTPPRRTRAPPRARTRSAS